MFYTTFLMATSSANLVNASSCKASASFDDMPTCKGMNNEHLVTVLRDTRHWLLRRGSAYGFDK